MNVTGCEFAGELCDFVRSDLAPRYGATLVSLIRVTLLQSGATLLSQFEKSLQDMALSDFRERVQVRLNARVRSVNASHVVLMDGSEVAYGMLVWAAGNGTREIVGKLIEAATGETTAKAMGRRGKLVTDAWLRVCGLRGVFAAGDCAEVVGEKLPSTAQVAGQQGAFLGRKCVFGKHGSM